MTIWFHINTNMTFLWSVDMWDFLSEIRTYQYPTIFASKSGFSCSTWKTVGKNGDDFVPKFELDFTGRFRFMFLLLSQISLIYLFGIVVSFWYLFLAGAIFSILSTKYGQQKQFCHLGARVP